MRFEFKLWLENEAELLRQFKNMYPLAGPSLDGYLVRSQIPNMGSINASLTDYEILPGVRAFPTEGFAGSSYYCMIGGVDRCKRLAQEIQQNRELNPLIIVEEKAGPYVLEGGHRMSAAVDLGIKRVPALIVIDLESFDEQEQA